MPNDETSTRRLLNLLLEGHLASFVRERRDQGHSWRMIERDLYERTKVDVTAETLRQWFGDRNGDKEMAK